MKNNLLLFFILLTLAAKSQTSVYHLFPESNAVWNIETDFYCWAGFPGSVYSGYSITFSTDTIINSRIYHTLKTPCVQTQTSGCGSGGTVFDIYKGAIRQDSAFRKVFFVPPSDTTEQLLYDFTMQVGDTVKGYIEAYNYPRDTVKSIDSVLVGGTYRKRWNINYCPNLNFIEGIGSTYALLVQSAGCVTDGTNYSLTCFQQNGQSLYPATTTSCELITSINSIDKISNQVNVFPNPSNGSFTIDFDLSIKEILLSDLLGNDILKHQANNQTKFKIDNLSSGTYILTIIDKDGRTTNKKIISCP